MTERIRIALNQLPPGGLALKRHILGRLLESAPTWLTAAQTADGGPNRIFASVWYALKALQRIGVIRRTRPEDEKHDVARYQLTPGTADIVCAFLLDEQHNEQHALSPLPAQPRLQRVLKIMCDEPEKSFAVRKLCDKSRHKEEVVRRSTRELYEAGYLIREMSDATKPGRPRFLYRLNPDAAAHAHALLKGSTS